MAIAKLNSALGQPNSFAIGIWKTPYDARMENPTNIIKHPDIKTEFINGFPCDIYLN